ncbi:MAG: aminoacyl-tRNA hydrolase [Intrasporangium sp.]|uniref:aminoacyl-tRNA hydrolase n=1 Tax=Intrasporangium sp. TaxID=1925024 RepID=UPI002647883C|nr:aminoacyl-tRNA hydrolase [Intrasporangium sp.]MDN5796761.1 aminoacyl-tRNA hydrolase [Intrasporangium sp.]
MPVETWLVVGLGNPGPRYAGNRHNVGAMVAAELVARHGGGSLKAHKTRASVCELRLGVASGGVQQSPQGQRAVVAVPSSYMNESGGPVSALLRFYSVDLGRLIVVHDELDIPAGTIRLKRGGGEGGHNGLRSVSKSLGTKDYLRVRVGIGRPPGRMDAADYVLRDFSAAERKELPLVVGDAADAVESLVAVGLVDSQQRFHAP